MTRDNGEVQVFARVHLVYMLQHNYTCVLRNLTLIDRDRLGSIRIDWQVCYSASGFEQFHVIE